MKTSKKVLVDNLGRIVGIVAPRTGKIGRHIEYGGVRDGVLDVTGIARIERKSIDDYAIEHLREYNGDTGRRINSTAAAALGSISTPKKAASSRENGKRGGRPINIEKRLNKLVNSRKSVSIDDLKSAAGWWLSMYGETTIDLTAGKVVEIDGTYIWHGEDSGMWHVLRTTDGDDQLYCLGVSDADDDAIRDIITEL